MIGNHLVRIDRVSPFFYVFWLENGWNLLHLQELLEPIDLILLLYLSGG